MELLAERLLNGPEFGPCREAMDEAGHQCVLPSRALCFLKPAQVLDVDHALVGKDLRHYNIVISSGFEYLLNEVLEAMPSRKRPRQKPAKQYELDMVPQQRDEKLNSRGQDLRACWDE